MVRKVRLGDSPELLGGKGQREEEMRAEALKLLPFHYTTPAGPSGAREEGRPLFGPSEDLG